MSHPPVCLPLAAPLGLAALLTAFAACSGGHAGEPPASSAAPPATSAPTPPPATSAPAPAASAPAPAASAPPPPVLKPMPSTIGVAKMLDDRTIVLDLYHPAMAQLTYAPSHPQYASTLRHLGGLRPGESKGVPPWPDDVDDAKVEAALRAYLPRKGYAYERCRAEIMGTSTNEIVVHARCNERPLSISLRKGTYEIVTFTDNGPSK
jgi:hypothetical protein